MIFTKLVLAFACYDCFMERVARKTKKQEIAITINWMFHSGSGSDILLLDKKERPYYFTE